MNETVPNETLPQTPAAQMKQNRFIPVDRGEIYFRLLDSVPWTEEERPLAEGALHYMARLRQQDSCVNLDNLGSFYDPFNPDDETVNSAGRETMDLEPALNTFGDQLAALAESANYERISPERLDRILTEVSPDGVEVEVDMKDFDLMILYARGESTKKKFIRTWQTFFLKKEVPVEVFSRLLMAVKLKPDPVRIEELKQGSSGNLKRAAKLLKKLRSSLPKNVETDKVYLKIFKDIPVVDMETLFPNTRVKLRYWDKVQLIIGGGGTTAVSIFTATGKVVAAAVLSPLVLLMAVGGLGGVLFRQVMNVINTRTKYMMHLAQTLYFHSLASNQSVLGYLVDEAEEENIKEEMLLYVSLLKGTRAPGQLERAKIDVEAFLLHHWGIDVDFDVYDAEARLRQNGIISTNPDGLLDIMTPGQARGQLMRLWAQSIERGRPVNIMAQ